MRRTCSLLAGSALFLAAAAPTSLPTSRPARTESAIGRLSLVPFANAPYPHASRADGYKTSAATYPAAGHYDDPTVAVFVPAGYAAGERVDFVVYFHGHRNHVENVLAQFGLPVQFTQSHVNAILLVPQGPRDVPDSGGGKLELDADGFKRFVDEATRVLKAEGVIHTDRVGSIVLAAHSGGYKTLAGVLTRGGMTDRVSDVLLFDASYGNLDAFATYAARPGVRLVSFHTKHLDDENVLLQGLLDKAHTPWRAVGEADLDAATAGQRGVTFVATTRPHDAVPGYLRLMLESSRLVR